MAVSLLLSAAVLAWGTVPPALRHAHEGGSETGHSHEALAEHHDAGEHHRRPRVGHSHEHEGRVAKESTVAGEVATHFHWAVFGLDFTMPARQDGEPDERESVSGPVLVRLTDELPTVTSGDREAPGGLLAAPPSGGLKLAAVEDAPPRPCHLVTSIPLCDTARLERSGVLLA